MQCLSSFYGSPVASIKWYIRSKLVWLCSHAIATGRASSVYGL